MKIYYLNASFLKPVVLMNVGDLLGLDECVFCQKQSHGLRDNLISHGSGGGQFLSAVRKMTLTTVNTHMQTNTKSCVN